MDLDGMVRVPLNRPGLGVTVDEDLIEALAVRREDLRPARVVVGA
jgi:L-alanine-DL-glutamate epimerase-like enolase superfamily enzyme